LSDRLLNVVTYFSKSTPHVSLQRLALWRFLCESFSRIKYNHLVANYLIFHNVHAMTQALHKVACEGVALSEEALRHLSPYLTEHVNRFGVYEWNPQRKAPAINYGLPILQMRGGAGA
jgi:hypothetical protein